MYLIQIGAIRFGSWKVRRLNRVLISNLVKFPTLSLGLVLLSFSELVQFWATQLLFFDDESRGYKLTFDNLHLICTRHLIFRNAFISDPPIHLYLSIFQTKKDLRKIVRRIFQMKTLSRSLSNITTQKVSTAPPCATNFPAFSILLLRLKPTEMSTSYSQYITRNNLIKQLFHSP